MTTKPVLPSAFAAFVLVVFTITVWQQASGQQAVALVRGPYLQLPAQDGTTVVWATRENVQPRVRYGLHWSAVDFDDSPWEAAGCGQPRDLSPAPVDPRRAQPPVYARHAFTLDDAASVEQTSLVLRTSDDFAVYLNGVRVANARSRPAEGAESAAPLTVTPTPSATGYQGLVRFDITSQRHLLRDGDNVLAIRRAGGRLLPSTPLLFAVELQRPTGLKRIGPGEWRYVAGPEEPVSLEQIMAGTSRPIEALDGHFEHRVALTGLSPGTPYAYQILAGGAPLAGGAVFSLRTPSPLEPFAFMAFGDSGSGSTEQSAIRNLLSAERFDLAIHTGDVSEHDGSYEDYQNVFFQVYAEMIARKPLVPVAGNSEYETLSGAPFRNVFVLPENAPPPDTERYFSFDYGGVHFVGLDSERVNAAQAAWLEHDLAAATQPWTVVYLHRHSFGEGSDHPIDEEQSVQIRTLFVPLFERYRVDLVFNGHNAIYARSAPLTGGLPGPPYATVTAPENGVVYVTTGGGGDPIDHPYTDRFHQPPEGTSIAVYHYVKVTVADCLLRLEAIDLSGQPIDQYVIDKCG